MSETPNSTQIISPFGSGYVPESHDPDRGEKPKPFHQQRGVIVLSCLFALFIAAGCIAVTAWSHKAQAPGETWGTPSGVLKLPGGFGVDDAVY